MQSTVCAQVPQPVHYGMWTVNESSDRLLRTAHRYCTGMYQVFGSRTEALCTVYHRKNIFDIGTLEENRSASNKNRIYIGTYGSSFWCYLLLAPLRTRTDFAKASESITQWQVFLPDRGKFVQKYVRKSNLKKIKLSQIIEWTTMILNVQWDRI